MNADILQKRMQRLVTKVEKMRYHQVQYFKYRAGTDLASAKRLEREVDQLIAEEIKIQQLNQKEIFNNGQTQ